MLKKLRVEKGLSQKELAEELGTTQQNINRIETTGGTSLELAFKISEYFNMPIEDIFLDKNPNCNEKDNRQGSGRTM